MDSRLVQGPGTETARNEDMGLDQVGTGSREGQDVGTVPKTKDMAESKKGAVQG